MPTANNLQRSYAHQSGVTLVELIVFIVVISLALGAMLGVYRYAITSSVDPIVRVRLLEAAQSRLDVVLAQPYDSSTPAGGIPSCRSSDMPAGNPPRPVCDDAGGVSTFDGEVDSPYDGYQREVSVAFAGTELGLANNRWAKRVTVKVTAPNGEALTLAAYRTNF